jgi:predicted dehydrogenase
MKEFIEMKKDRFMSRRGFLSLAAVSALAPSVAHVGFTSSNVVRVGVIGCGARGVELARTIAVHPGRAIVSAICDASPSRAEAAAAITKAEVVSRWEDLLERRDIDAVVVATPDHLHAPISIAAMECGKDVYCERPMTLHLDKAKAFRDAAERTRRIVQIGAYQTSQPQWRVAREVIQSGAIGAPTWCQGGYRPSSEIRSKDAMCKTAATELDVDWTAFAGIAASSGSDADRFYNWRNYWDYSIGVAGDVFYHKLAALLIAVDAGYPERVSAAGGVYARDSREVPDSFVMTAEYAGGVSIVLASSMPNRDGVPAIIRGQDAAIELHGDSVRIMKDAAPNAPSVLPCATSALEEHVGDWLACISERRKCVCNEEVGYKAMVAVAMAVESYQSGKTVGFDPVSNQIVSAGNSLSV